jgi:hypothetical protein
VLFIPYSTLKIYTFTAFTIFDGIARARGLFRNFHLFQADLKNKKGMLSGF